MEEDEKKGSAVVLVSGGLDSAVLAYDVIRRVERAIGLTVRYGQKTEECEVVFASKICRTLDMEHVVLDFSDLGRVLPANAMIRGTLPKGYDGHHQISPTYIPARNALLFAAAYSIAGDRGCDIVAAAIHGGGADPFPDARSVFAASFFATMLFSFGTDYGASQAPFFLTPFINATKTEIIQLGAELGVNWRNTWTCVARCGGLQQCGECSTCVRRLMAFAEANIKDTQSYADLALFEEMKLT